MDLLACTWMTRSLGEAVASVALEEDDSVLVGGWNGTLKRWDEKGDLLWSAQLNDRINDLALGEDCIIATAGLHLVCLERSTGDVRWSHALEGSADSTLLFQDIVYAVSSVYDIEHNDFIESAVWAFDLNGDQLWVNRMDERPWTMLAHQDSVWLGLGRPKCGFATLGADGALEHQKEAADSPVTSGSACEQRLLFGHANGTVSNRSSEVLLVREHGIESLDCFEHGWALADESGSVCLFDEQGNERWCLEGDAVEAHMKGFDSNGKATHWIARWSGVSGYLVAVDGHTGAELASSSDLHPRFIDAKEHRVLVGCENGDVHVWERGVFDRRFGQKDESTPIQKDARRTALQDKLRKLRDR